MAWTSLERLHFLKFCWHSSDLCLSREGSPCANLDENLLLEKHIMALHKKRDHTHSIDSYCKSCNHTHKRVVCRIATRVTAY